MYFAKKTCITKRGDGWMVKGLGWVVIEEMKVQLHFKHVAFMTLKVC